MGARLKYEGTAREREAQAAREIKVVFSKLADQLLKWLQDESPKGASPKDKSFKFGWRSRIRGAGTNKILELFNRALHAIFVNEGRGANKPMPPPDRIFPWVKKKGIGSTPKSRRLLKSGSRSQRRAARQSLDKQQRAIAFVIARAIGRRGIEGLLLDQKVLTENKSRIDRAMKQVERRIAAVWN